MAVPNSPFLSLISKSAPANSPGPVFLTGSDADRDVMGQPRSERIVGFSWSTPTRERKLLTARPGKLAGSREAAGPPTQQHKNLTSHTIGYSRSNWRKIFAFRLPETNSTKTPLPYRLSHWFSHFNRTRCVGRPSLCDRLAPRKNRVSVTGTWTLRGRRRRPIWKMDNNLKPTRPTHGSRELHQKSPVAVPAPRVRTLACHTSPKVNLASPPTLPQPPSRSCIYQISPREMKKKR